MTLWRIENKKNQKIKFVNSRITCYTIFQGGTPVNLYFNPEGLMGKFLVKETSTGIKFDLKAGNGEVIATSEVYTSKSACMNGIASVKKNSVIADVEDQTVDGFEKKKTPKYEVYTDKKGEFRFRLKASNGEIIATGEGYKAKAGCMNGIESIKKNAPDAEIVEEKK